MKRLWIWILVVAVVGLVSFAFCAKAAQAVEQTDMYGRTLWKASTGDMWMEFHKKTLDEEDCSTATVELYPSDVTTPYSFARIWSATAFTSYTPGTMFSGGYDGPYEHDHCDEGAPPAGTQEYLLWPDSNESLEEALIAWAEGSAPTLAIYVGRFVGASIATGEPCETCLVHNLSSYSSPLRLADDSEPYWEMRATAVTSGPSGCRPECSLSEKPATGTTWGTVKSLYATP